MIKLIFDEASCIRRRIKTLLLLNTYAMLLFSIGFWDKVHSLPTPPFGQQQYYLLKKTPESSVLETLQKGPALSPENCMRPFADVLRLPAKAGRRTRSAGTTHSYAAVGQKPD